MPIDKTAIQELSGDQLESLVKFSKGKEFELLMALADREKYKRYLRDFLTAQSTEEINFLRGINVGIDFIMDSARRAKEELVARGVEFDNEE